MTRTTCSLAATLLILTGIAVPVLAEAPGEKDPSPQEKKLEELENGPKGFTLAAAPTGSQEELSCSTRRGRIRYGATVSYGLYEFTTLSLEYLYSDPDLAENRASQVTAQLALEF